MVWALLCSAAPAARLDGQNCQLKALAHKQARVQVCQHLTDCDQCMSGRFARAAGDCAGKPLACLLQESGWC